MTDLESLAHRARLLAGLRYQQALARRDVAEMQRAVAEWQARLPLRLISATKAEQGERWTRTNG